MKLEIVIALALAGVQDDDGPGDIFAKFFNNFESELNVVKKDMLPNEAALAVKLLEEVESRIEVPASEE